MWTFIDTYSDEEILALCGLSLELMKEIYIKYCGEGTPINRPQYLWFLFMWYKLYPVSRASRIIHGDRYNDHRYFLTRIHEWQVSCSVFCHIKSETMLVLRSHFWLVSMCTDI